MRHDESFKILLQLHPAEVVLAFAPELAAEFGIAYHATMRLRASRDGLRHLEALLPLIQTLPHHFTESLAEFHALLREEPEMVSVVDLFRAEGKAEGMAEAFIAMILEFRRDGVLTTDQARIRLQHVAEQRQITPEQLTSALAGLG